MGRIFINTAQNSETTEDSTTKLQKATSKQTTGKSLQLISQRSNFFNTEIPFINKTRQQKYTQV